MTEQKPPGVSWDSWIDHPDWWIKQLVKREQITSVPPALEVLRKVEAALAAIPLDADGIVEEWRRRSASKEMSA